MACVGIHIATIGSIPHLHRLVATSRSDALPIRRPCYLFHSTGMSTIRVYVLAVHCIPYLDRFSWIFSRSNPLTVGRPFCCSWILPVEIFITMYIDIPTVQGIPHLYCSIVSCRGDTPVIYRPAHSRHRIICMPSIDVGETRNARSVQICRSCCPRVC